MTEIPRAPAFVSARNLDALSQEDARLLWHLPVDMELHDGGTLEDWGEPVTSCTFPDTPWEVSRSTFSSGGVLFSDDIVATAEGRSILRPFDVDREQEIGSFRRLASLEAEALCVPHGEPVLKGTREVLRAADPENDGV